MNSQVVVAPPVAVIYKEEVLATGVLAPAPPLDVAARDPNQISQIDQVFTENHQQADAMVSLVGVYTSLLLLRDLALDTFSPPAGELEDEALRKPRLKTRPPEPGDAD